MDIEALAIHLRELLALADHLLIDGIPSFGRRAERERHWGNVRQF